MQRGSEPSRFRAQNNSTFSLAIFIRIIDQVKRMIDGHVLKFLPRCIGFEIDNHIAIDDIRVAR